jgi:hypothetical protein
MRQVVIVMVALLLFPLVVFAKSASEFQIDGEQSVAEHLSDAERIILIVKTTDQYNAAFARGDYEGAIKAANVLVGISPTNVEFLREKAKMAALLSREIEFVETAIMICENPNRESAKAAIRAIYGWERQAPFYRRLVVAVVEDQNRQNRLFCDFFNDSGIATPAIKTFVPFRGNDTVKQIDGKPVVEMRKYQPSDIEDTPGYLVRGESTSREILTGPRGGRYYINSNGNKTYLK